MGLFRDELNKTAVVIGKVIKFLDYYAQGKLSWYDHEGIDRNRLLVLSYIAYLCRVGILDRIERNYWSMTMPISIPLGLFKFKQVTLAIAMMQTVVWLKDIVVQDEVANKMVNDILDRGRFYHEFLKTGVFKGVSDADREAYVTNSLDELVKSKK